MGSDSSEHRTGGRVRRVQGGNRGSPWLLDPEGLPLVVPAHPPARTETELISGYWRKLFAALW